MKKRIVINIQPFVFTQHIEIYTETGNKTGDTVVSLAAMPNAIKELCLKNDIHQVDISGNKFFASKIQKDLIKAIQYSKSNLDINVTLH